jgi:hypothetical protein
MRNALVGLLLILALPVAAQAAPVFLTPVIALSVESVPTPGLPGMVTNTLIFSVLAPGDSIVGFDGKFIGAMNQVNPFDDPTVFPTVFRDNNVMFAFIGADVKQDSQFLFKTSTDDAVNGALVDRAGESATLLDGRFTLNGGRSNPFAGNPVAIAQLVMPAGASVLDYIDPASWLRIMNSNDIEVVIWPIPEPATLSLLALCGMRLLPRGRRGRR